MANDHAAHGKTVPKFAGWPRDSEAGADAAIDLSGCDKDIPVAFGGDEVRAEMKPAHAQHSLADVALTLAESCAGKNLEEHVSEAVVLQRRTRKLHHCL